MARLTIPSSAPASNRVRGPIPGRPPDLCAADSTMKCAGPPIAAKPWGKREVAGHRRPRDEARLMAMDCPERHGLLWCTSGWEAHH